MEAAHDARRGGAVIVIVLLAAAMHAPPGIALLGAAIPDPAPSFVPEACRGQSLVARTASADRAAGSRASSRPSPPKEKALSRTRQRALFASLAAQVRARYVDPTFAGRDWAKIEARYQATVAKGLSTNNYYATLDRFIRELGDEHSFFQSPGAVEAENRARAEAQGDASFVGIGVYADPVPEGVAVLSTTPGSPAEASGLASRDLILSIDGVAATDVRARTLFRGPPCSVAVLSVATPGTPPRRLAVVRTEVTGRPAVDARVFNAPNGQRIGYVMLPTFLDAGLPAAIRTALEGFGPLDGMILDERMNGGGQESVLRAMLAMFAGGPMGEFVSRAVRRPLEVTPSPVHTSQGARLAVIVGPRTVSFGEVFAGILQDGGRAKIVGTRSKGNVEALSRIDGDDGSRVWLAAERFEPRVTKANWEGVGIVADVQVSAEWHAFRFEDDPAVAASVQLLVA